MEKSSQSKVLVAVLILLALGIGAYLVLFVFPTKSKEFSGIIDHVSGNSIFIKGSYLVNGKVYSKGGLKDVEVLVTPETKFNDTAVQAPTMQELAKTNGAWDMSTLKKEVIAGSIADLTSNSSVVYVQSDTNIFNQPSFNAATINYSTIALNQEDSVPPVPRGICDDANGNYIGAAACMKISNVK